MMIMMNFNEDDEDDEDDDDDDDDDSDDDNDDDDDDDGGIPGGLVGPSKSPTRMIMFGPFSVHWRFHSCL